MHSMWYSLTQRIAVVYFFSKLWLFSLPMIIYPAIVCILQQKFRRLACYGVMTFSGGSYGTVPLLLCLKYKVLIDTCYSCSISRKLSLLSCFINACHLCRAISPHSPNIFSINPVLIISPRYFIRVVILPTTAPHIVFCLQYQLCLYWIIMDISQHA